MPGTLSIRFDGANYFVLDTTSSGTTTYGPYSTRADAEAQLALLSPAASVEPDVDVDGSTATGFVEFDELAGNPLTPGENVLRLFAKDNGSGITHLYKRIYGGNVKRLMDEDDGTAFPSSVTGGTFALNASGGFVVGVALSSGAFTASALGSSAFGYITGAGSTIVASGKGAHASGRAVGGGDITASQIGAHALGGVAGSGALTASGQYALAVGGAYGASSNVTASGRSAIAAGYAANGATVRASGTSLAFGKAKYGLISAGSSGWSGNVAFGYTRYANCQITADGTYGAFAFGYATGYGATLSHIQASGQGSFAGGLCYAGPAAASTARIRASGRGAMAHGYVTRNGGDLNASAFGAHVFGYSYGVAITGSGKGAVAMGYGKTNAITSSGKGSGAFGYSASAAIVASANNAFQFGPGTNSVANSLQIGAAAAGIHLHGGGAPGAPANGDIWNTGTLVTIRSDGVNFVLDQQATIVDADGTLADITTKFNSLLAKLETVGVLASA